MEEEEEGGGEEEEETTKKPSTDNKEAIDRQQRGHRQPSSDNRPETATNNHSHECMCVCGCMFVDVFAHIHTSKGEKTKKRPRGERARAIRRPPQGDPEKSGSVPTRNPVSPTRRGFKNGSLSNHVKGTCIFS